MMVGPAAAGVSAQQRRPLQVDDLFAIKSVGNPVLSPDGAWVAYTVTETSLEEEKAETRLWMAPADSGEALPLTAKGGSVGSPGWSPDGRYISFTASRNEGESQVWILDRRGGEAQQLTEVKQGIGSYTWSPDATRLALTITDPEPEDSLKGARAKTTKPYVIDRLQFKQDYQGYLTGNRKTHIYVFDLATKALTQVTSGAWNESNPVWSPDGTHIAFVSKRTPDPDTNDNSDIWVVQAAEGAEPRRLTENPGSDGSPAWSPDGELIAYTRNLNPEIIWYDITELAVVPSAGGTPLSLTGALDRNVSGPVFSGDGAEVWFQLEDSGAEVLAAVPVSGGAIRRIVDGDLSLGGFDVKAGVAVGRVSHLDLPSEIFRFSDGALNRITTVNDAALKGIQLAGVAEVRFNSPDGTEVEGFVTFPLGFQQGTRYPTLLRIHGGPVAQYDFGFNFEAQLFAAHGYLVIQTNPRGSSGYGRAFSQALWADWGGPDFEDVMAGVDFTISHGWADPERLGVGGWSYGGILTDHVITKTDRFKAAISGASEVLYRSNYGHDHYQRYWEAELGLPWGDTAASWERISPFNFVDRVTTPTLIMGGQDDWNVPILNSEQLYQALRRLGVPTQLVVYPRQGHGIRVPSYQKDRYERYLAWYDRYLKPGQ